MPADDADDSLQRTLAHPSWLPKPGDVLADRYRILGHLGSGGMGSVHRALDTELDEEVALKLLRPELAAEGAALVRFRREVKLARRVTHPNVARTYDLGRSGATRFLTMELIEGEPLSRRLRSTGRLSLAEAVRVAAEIARGLTAAHGAGVVHRDLKPDNVMLADARVCLTDFGIARLAEGVGDDGAHHTVGAVGTPAYMAPEQVEGRELDGRADVYALGVLLFECLTGRLPFESESPLGLAAMRLMSPAPDPRIHLPSLPAALAELIAKMLSRAREERLDAQAALERLDVLSGQGGAPVAAAPQARSRIGATLSRGVDRWTVAAWMEGSGDAASELAAQLDEALDEAFASLSSFDRVPSAAVRAAAAPDELALARRVGADLVLHGSVRVAGERIRLRLRLVERTDGRCLWQTREDGETSDPFDLEDRVIGAVRQHLARRFTTPDTTDRGPKDAQLRDVYHRARVLMFEHSYEAYARAIELLEEAHAAHPDDPWIAGLLARGLVRRLASPAASSTPAADVARSEELALRALAADPQIAETYETLGVLRFMQGDYRRSVRAFREALARDPFLAESHGYLARLLEESGRGEEAIERATLALRIDPEMTLMHLTLASVALWAGDAEAMEEQLALFEERGSKSPVPTHLRMMCAGMWRDARIARRGLESLERGYDGPYREGVRKVLRHVTGEEPLSSDDALIEELAAPGAPLRTRSRGAQLEAFVLALAGAPNERVLDAIERAAEAIVNLAWLDSDPLLAPVREDPRFARARALVAARVAEMWA